MSVIRQLIHKGLLTQNITRNLVLQLTEAARPVLRGEVKLDLAVPRLQPISSRKEKRNGLLDNANYDKRLFRSCAPCASRSPRMKRCRPTWCSTMPPWSRWRS